MLSLLIEKKETLKRQFINTKAMIFMAGELILNGPKEVADTTETTETINVFVVTKEGIGPMNVEVEEGLVLLRDTAEVIQEDEAILEVHLLVIEEGDILEAQDVTREAPEAILEAQDVLEAQDAILAAQDVTLEAQGAILAAQDVTLEAQDAL